MKKGMCPRSALSLILFLILNGCAATHGQGINARIDEEIDRLCAKDGGSTVFETVPLPPGVKLFHHAYASTSTISNLPLGSKASKTYITPLPSTQLRRELNTKIFDPKAKENALGPDYIWENLVTVLYQDDTSGLKVSRLHCQIIRKADNKLLGEIVYYVRTGGNSLPLRLLLMGGYTIHGCPKDLSPRNFQEKLISDVFIETKPNDK